MIYHLRLLAIHLLTASIFTSCSTSSRFGSAASNNFEPALLGQSQLLADSSNANPSPSPSLLLRSSEFSVDLAASNTPVASVSPSTAMSSFASTTNPASKTASVIKSNKPRANPSYLFPRLSAWHFEGEKEAENEVSFWSTFWIICILVIALLLLLTSLGGALASIPNIGLQVSPNAPALIIYILLFCISGAACIYFIGKLLRMYSGK